MTQLKTILRNPELSDDVGFRFSDRRWSEWPLTPEKFARWIAASEGDVINLFMDYESIGEHQWQDTGIFSFWKHLPQAVIDEDLRWVTPCAAGTPDKPITVVAASNAGLGRSFANLFQASSRRSNGHITESMPSKATPRMIKGMTVVGRLAPPGNPTEATAALYFI